MVVADDLYRIIKAARQTRIDGTVGQLEYYIIERALLGSIGGKRLHMFALSGGGGGSRGKRGIFPTEVVNNPYFESKPPKHAESDPKHEHGGPLPLGWYTVSPPRASTKAERAQMGRCAKLTPRKWTNMMNRRGMFIHGQGLHGSDGCIVPVVEKKEFHAFMDSLDREGGATLYVGESIEGYRFA